MAALNMVRKGLFGELLHATCGYEHDLRDVKFNDGKHYTYQKGGELRMGKDAFAEAQWRKRTPSKRRSPPPNLSDAWNRTGGKLPRHQPW